MHTADIPPASDKDILASLLRALGIGLSVGLGGWIGWWLPHTADTLGKGPLASFGLVLAGYAGFLLLFLPSVLLHELGHWLGARWVRFPVQEAGVLWWRLGHSEGRWRLRLGARLPGMLGYVRALPADFTDFRRRQALYLAAGSVANLLTGLPCLLLGYYLQSRWAAPVLAGGYLAGQATLLFGALSLAQGVINLLPMTPRTDGTKLLELWRNGAPWHRQVALVHVLNATVQHCRPRDWNSDWLPPLLAVADQSATECLAHYFAYAHALDSGESDAACLYLQRAAHLRKTTAPAFQQAICCEVIYCNVMLAGEPAQAAPWLELAHQAKPLRPDEKPFTRAIVAYSQQNRAEALHWLHHYETELTSLSASSVKEQAQELLAATRATVEQLPGTDTATPRPAARPAAAG